MDKYKVERNIIWYVYYIMNIICHYSVVQSAEKQYMSNDKCWNWWNTMWMSAWQIEAVYERNLMQKCQMSKSLMSNVNRGDEHFTYFTFHLVFTRRYMFWHAYTIPEPFCIVVNSCSITMQLHNPQNERMVLIERALPYITSVSLSWWGSNV